jgi:hypothetical protein
MTQQHPIAPPPELVQKWEEQFEAGRSLYAMFEDIYRAGADQELEALLVWLRVKGFDNLASDLLSARRPKPPSLKYQALKSLGHINKGIDRPEDTDIIRRALEQLDD